MQIRRLKIDDHKCLVDFEINFTTTDSGSSTILIGENGTGKSTMMESVLEILMSFFSPTVARKVDYDYEIEYNYAQKNILIIKSGGYYHVVVDGELFAQGRYLTVRERIKEVPNSILPNRVISFYSGLNNKIAPLIEQIETSYRIKCINEIRLYRNEQVHGTGTFVSSFPEQRFIYCKESFVPVYLCALLCGNPSNAKRQLINNCDISGIDRIDIELNTKKVSDIYGIQIRNHEDLYSIFNIIEYIDANFVTLFRNASFSVSGKKLYFSLETLMDLNIDSVSILNFFEKLSTVFNAKIIAYPIYKGTAIRCEDLSEGQRQLIKVLGMLSACKSEDTLVLMDEPDAHMNPRWKYELNSIIADCIEDGPINTQAIIATHDPLIINGVKKEFIRIFRQIENVAEANQHITKVIEPAEDTSGMGIDGILQSEYYGLNSTLDIQTQEKLEDKRALMVKQKEGTISPEERNHLQDLTEQIESLAFTKNIPTDNYYDEFVVAMQKYYKNRPCIKLTAEEIEERNRKALEIIERLMNP